MYLFQLLLDPPVLIIFFLFYVIKAEPPISGDFFQAILEKNEFRVPLHLLVESDCRMVVLLPLSRTLLEGWPSLPAIFHMFLQITGIVLITIQRLCACCYRHRDFTKVWTYRIMIYVTTIEPTTIETLCSHESFEDVVKHIKFEWFVECWDFILFF